MRIKRAQISGFLTAVSVILLITACSKPNGSSSNIPKITFDGCDVRDSIDTTYTKYHNVTLHIGFSDGDGDLGLSKTDINPPYDSSSIYYNDIFVAYYERINGQFRQITSKYPFSTGDTINYNGRFPSLTPIGKHKAIQGELSYTLYGVRPRAGDEVKFKVWVYDRALHKSNVVESPGIVLN
jgi:hypothetical protein